jgi:hypothetical protein
MEVEGTVMSVKEKLVELIMKSGEICYSYTSEELADHLIAHGVTVQEQNGCEHCRTASYTENPFTVITQMGREVKTQFNFCPNCGRGLSQPPEGE